jgi:hypothetical protein
LNHAWNSRRRSDHRGRALTTVEVRDTTAKLLSTTFMAVPKPTWSC